MKKQASAQTVIHEDANLGPIRIVHDVRLLPPPIQQAIRNFIIAGASVENAMQNANERMDWFDSPDGAAPALKDRPRFHVTFEAVQHYLSSDLQLQRERAHYLVENAETIIKSFSKDGDLEEGEKRYALAVVMSGLQNVNVKDGSVTVKDVLRNRQLSYNLHLKTLILRAELSEISQRTHLMKAQSRLIVERAAFVHQQTVKLQDLVRKLEKKKSITPETLQKIQEVYGILAENVAQASPEPTLEEFRLLYNGKLPLNQDAEALREYDIPAQGQQPAEPQTSSVEGVQAQYYLTQGEYEESMNDEG